MSNTKTEAQRLADWADDRAFSDAAYCNCQYNAIAAELRRLDAENKELREALTLAHENYEFQRNKANGATSTVYAFHYAMKDAGWHPGRTDDDLTEIIRQKGKALAEAEAERDQLRAQVELLTATQTPGALIGGGAPSQEPAVNQQLTTEPFDERGARATLPTQRSSMDGLPKPFGYVSDGFADGLRFQHNPWPVEHTLLHSTMPVFSAAAVQQFKQDAERYRWLADSNNYYEAINLISDGSLTEDALGKAIDAEMAQGVK